MTEFYLTPEAVKASRQLVLKRSLFFIFSLTVGGFCYSYLVLHAELVVAMLTTLVLDSITLFSYFYNIRQQKQLVQSYRLLLEAGSISRTQLNTPTIQMAANDITGITQNAQGVLIIASTNKYRSIYVPFQVTNRTELLQQLERFAPITILEHKSFLEKLTPFTSIIILGLMGTFYTVNNKIASILTGIVFLGMIGYSIWYIWHSKSMTRQTRLILWFLPVVFLSILAGLVSRLLQ